MIYRFKKKLGLASYEDYKINNYYALLKSYLANNDINFIFLNLTNTAPFALLIKKHWPNVKVILCSHGNESGDHLHDINLHNKHKGFFKNTAIYSLGNMLTKESIFRKYIDLVLTVSDVEVGIEKWLSAKQVFMVPRFIEKQNEKYNPTLGRVGFISDLSHEPNYFGILEVCKELNFLTHQPIKIRLVGGGKVRGELLEKQYSFIEYLGYLPAEKIVEEISTWTFSLNPVFFYSRGVSTKLAKSLGMGYPVITTHIGMRGYAWHKGNLPVCNTAKEMAILITQLSLDKKACDHYKNEVIKIQHSSPSLIEMIKEINNLLN